MAVSNPSCSRRAPVDISIETTANSPAHIAKLLRSLNPELSIAHALELAKNKQQLLVGKQVFYDEDSIYTELLAGLRGVSCLPSSFAWRPEGILPIGMVSNDPGQDEDVDEWVASAARTDAMKLGALAKSTISGFRCFFEGSRSGHILCYLAYFYEKNKVRRDDATLYRSTSSPYWRGLLRSVYPNEDALSLLWNKAEIAGFWSVSLPIPSDNYALDAGRFLLEGINDGIYRLWYYPNLCPKGRRHDLVEALLADFFAHREVDQEDFL